jgi:hypothetical protein
LHLLPIFPSKFVPPYICRHIISPSSASSIAHTLHLRLALILVKPMASTIKLHLVLDTMRSLLVYYPIEYKVLCS